MNCKLFFISCTLIISSSARAYDFSAKSIEDKTIYYNIVKGCAEVTYKNRQERYSGTITIPNVVTYNGAEYSVTSIGDFAFEECKSLTQVIIPNSVTKIGHRAFSGWANLIELTLPNWIAEIGSYAFSDCKELTKVILPNSVTKIGANPFSGCSKLTKFEGEHSNYDGRCLVKDGQLISFAPAYLSSYAISYSITKIGKSAFDSCTDLTRVDIPNSVTEIGDKAFYSCSGLTKITIPNSVKEIGVSAFQYCERLTKITIPNSVTEIKDMTFQKCTELETIIIPNSIMRIGCSSFEYCKALNNLSIPSSVAEIGGSAFFGCEKLEEITIPSAVTKIGNSAFSYCNSLTAFYGKFSSEDNRSLIMDDRLIGFAPANLTSYIIPNTVTSIGERVFYMYKKIREIYIPETVTDIGLYAFGFCGIRSISIPKSVNKIDDYAFWSCWASVIDIYWNSPEDVSLGYRVFDYGVSNRVLRVPAGTKSLYETSSQWSNFENPFTIVERESDGINELLEDEKKLLTYNDGNLQIYGTNLGDRIHIYNIKGNLLYSGFTTNGITTIDVAIPKGEFIIVKIGGKVMKVV